MKTDFFAFVIFAAIGFQAELFADTFGTGENSFEIPFVTIGDPGNAPDTTGSPNPAGAVAYEYRIGKYEIPEEAIRKANAASEMAGNPLGITLDQRGPQKPATRVSWFEAAQFVNWLNEEKGATPAYKFDDQGEFQLWEPTDAGYDPDNLFRNREARYFLPSVDEWYKAAFYDPVLNQYFDYPNGSDTPPMPVAFGTDFNTAVYDQLGPADVMQAGGESPFGTVAQAGNVWEMEETEVDLVNDSVVSGRALRGSDWGSVGITLIDLSSSFRNFGQSPANSVADIGFRIASIVPETSSIFLVLIAASCHLLSYRSRLPQRL